MNRTEQERLELGTRAALWGRGEHNWPCLIMGAALRSAGWWPEPGGWLVTGAKAELRSM
jgi:hypothetical protein